MMNFSGVLPVRRKFSMIFYASFMGLFALALLWGWIMLSRPAPIWIVGAAALVITAVLRPQWWLVCLLALWPIADQVGWTGNAFVTESDAVLASLWLGLALHTLLRPVSDTAQMRLRWSRWTLALVWLLGASFVLAFCRGITPFPALNETSFVLFGSRMEAWRLARGAFFALLCLPWLGRYGSGLRYLSWAAVCALLGIGCSVLLERLSFTALADFSSSYRTSGPFWEMLVGGSSLDGALLLTLPFALWFGFRAHGPLKWLSMLASLLGAYAILVGFTRSTYGAAFVCVTVLLLFFLRQRTFKFSAEPVHQSSFHWPVLSLLLAWLVGAAVSFPTSGYRGLLALLAFTACAWLIGAWDKLLRQRTALSAGVLLGFILIAVGVAVELFWSRAIYAQIFTSLALCLLGAFLRERAAGRPLPAALGIAGLLCSGATALRVAVYWGGAPAALPMLLGVLLVAAPLIYSLSHRAGPLWLASGHALTPVALIALCASMGVVIANSDYAASRFSSVNRDMQARIDLWQNVLELVDTPTHAIFGRGAGRFIPSFQAVGAREDISGGFNIIQRPYWRSLVLSGALRPVSTNELFRLSQRLMLPQIALPAHVGLLARTKTPTQVAVSICRNHLVAPSQCASAFINVPGDDQWHSVSTQIQDEDLPRGAPYTRRPLVFSMGVQTPKSYVEVTQVQLLDAHRRSMLENSDFSQATYRWFPSSENRYASWHATNLFLHILVENGLFGLLALSLALGWALWRASVTLVFLHPYAAPLVAGLIGLSLAGLFDTVIDSPRVLFMFTLWIGMTLGLPVPNLVRRH